MIDPGTFTLSEPKKSFGEWMRQKTRHYSTGKFYKFRHQFLLGLYSFSHFLFYPVFIVSLFVFDWRWVLGVFGVRFLVQAIVYYKSMDKLGEKDLFAWWWLLDIWMFLYYIIFLPALWKKPRPNWN